MSQIVFIAECGTCDKEIQTRFDEVTHRSVNGVDQIVIDADEFSITMECEHCSHEYNVGFEFETLEDGELPEDHEDEEEDEDEDPPMDYDDEEEGLF